MNKKIMSLALATLMITASTSFTAFAAIPTGTVVIGNKAFDLQYANNPTNVVEVTNEIVAGGLVYVKNFSGNWVDNVTGNQVDVSVIPAVVYKNATEIINFLAEDKSVVVSPVIPSSGGGNASIGGGNTSSDEVSETPEAPKPIPTINITSDNYRNAVVANGEIININLSINDIRPITIAGNSPKVTIDAASSSIVLNGANITVLDVKDIANHSLYVKGGTIDTLIVEDTSNDAHIVTIGDAIVNSATIQSGATIDSKATSTNSFKNITVNYNDTSSSVVLTGNLGATNVQLVKANKVKIEANLNDVSISNQVGNVTIADTSNINSLVVNTTGSVISLVDSNNNAVSNLERIFSIVSNIVTTENTALMALDSSTHAAALAQRQGDFNSFITEISTTLGENNEDFLVYKSRNSDALTTLIKYKDKFLGLKELSSLSEKQQLRYAASFRSRIRFLQVGNVLDYNIIQNNIISTYASIQPLIESSKFKGHYEGQTPIFEVTCPDSDTEIDVTDLFIQFDSPLSDISSYRILNVYESFSYDDQDQMIGKLNPYFNVKDVAGQNRIFMVPTNNTTSSSIEVIIDVNYMESYSNTNLSINLNFPLQALRIATP